MSDDRSPTRLVAHKEPWSLLISLYLFTDHIVNGRVKETRFAEKLALSEHEEGSLVQPFTSIDPTTAQGLMDSLWECGVRPTEGKGSAGAMMATQGHLDDLRKILFKTLNIEQGEG